MLRTLANPAKLIGVGLHSGAEVVLTISPVSPGSGIRFVRTDVPEGTGLIEARYDNVSDTQLCTRLTNEHGVSVGTVEHVMAALAGLGINDAELVLNGPEVPIMDGSSAAFIAALLSAGVVTGDGVQIAIRVRKTIRVEDGDKWAELSPADSFEMSYAISFEDPAIGEQAHDLTLVNGAFVGELSDCRTFGHLHEVEYMRSLGLARGGSLQNAIVVDHGRVLNPEGLRRPDEFVRHKMLDAVGDLALAGAPIKGRYTAYKSGHGLTNQLLRALFDDPEAWTWDELGADEGLGACADQMPTAANGGPAMAV